MGFLSALRGWIPRREIAPVPVVLYTREACPLCERMRAAIDSAALGDRIDLVVLDVDADPELCARHGTEVPVLEVGGGTRFVARVEPRELALAVDRAARARRRGGR